ncbi:flagellar biosynthetic protein FliR [uncultured Desulfobacter sp.]|uniref:flagellar biosynthetic protein FliR n=1 Tax=uncultured Desulfobacter sp. TaxID=240139 RepID=UPI0029C75BF1|nr:flagellar biosynthetic protein FliR [uncultured Desulfobacter sp.]
MELLDLIDPIRFRTFMLVLARVSVFLFLFPFFTSSAIPTRVKAAISLVLTLVFYTVQ